MNKTIGGIRSNIKLNIFFVVCSFIVSLVTVGPSWAVVNDLAIYRPEVQGGMSPQEQQACSDYILTNTVASSKVVFAGFQQETIDSLNNWITPRINDGKSDVLVIVDMCPGALFQGEDEGSLAEQWTDGGNMLIWTGSEPFAHYVGLDGAVGGAADGASKVLDVSSGGLCTGAGMQEPTTAVWDQADADGDYNISSFVQYEAQNALKYDQLLIDALSSDWHHMSYWRVDEVFAEDSEGYQSDNIILVNSDGGQYGQFYCLPGMNDSRMQVITQVLNNWVALACNTLVVPDQYSTIQAAINAAQPRDTVLVKAGTYNEQLVMKRGIKLVSDADDGGNDLVPGPGNADALYGVESKMVLRRATRTIIDGTGKPGGTEAQPMVDFPKGSTVGTVLDGFTVTNMPTVNHTIPGHAHVVQTRGASGTMINNIVCNNGSSGLGSHAWFFDQEAPMETRDFRYTNIMYDAHPILINNVVYRNEGNNLGNNHYAYAIMYNNECFESISVGDHDSPGIGNQHGAHALIVGNLVYKSDWVGIGARKGDEQGAYPVNRPTHPIARNNRVYDSGENDTSGTGECGAGMGADDTGGYDPKIGANVYHIIEGNYVNGAANAAIGCRSFDGNDTLPDTPKPKDPPNLGHVKIIDNEVTNGGRGGYGAGIGLNGAHAVEITGNVTYGNNAAGIGVRGGGSCDLMSNNHSYENGAAGIGLCDGARAGEISDNDINDNGAAGIGHDGTAGRVTVQLEARNTIANNHAAGMGIISSDIAEISDNVIEHNHLPGITVVGESVVTMISENTLDYNGICGPAAGLVVQSGSSAVIKDTTISHSGQVGVSILDPGTSVSLEDCTIDHSGQTGVGPNLTVQGSATAQVGSCTLAVTIGAPNISVFGADTQLTMYGCMVAESAKPGLVGTDARLKIRKTVFDHNGTDGTVGMLLTNCHISFSQVTICDSAHWGASMSGCNGSLEQCDIYYNSGEGGGQLTISNSTLDILRNVVRDAAGYHNQIQLLNGSSCNVYHNTVVGNSDGGGGPINQGPGDGLHVDATSIADVRNNIFYALPRGITMDEGAVVAASTNCFYLMSGFTDPGIIGDNIILSNPYLVDQYYLDPYSPCVDAAEPIPGVNDVYSGDGPDVGAKEGDGPRGELVWKTPTAVSAGNMPGAGRLIDDDLSTGIYWGGYYTIFEIADQAGMPVPVYGIRFYPGPWVTKWHAYVSDNPDGPWEVITRWFGWDVGEGVPGEWDEYSVDFFRTGKYIKLLRWYGPPPADYVYEFDVQTRYSTDNPDVIAVDNTEATFVDTWDISTSVLGYYATDYQTHAAGAGEATATWTPEIVTPGMYEVYARWTAHENRATNAPYTINHDGGSETVTVNQQVEGGRWVFLGTYPFAAGTSGNIVLSNDADGYVIADAVLLILK